MVYRGEPSAACNECRTAKKRCDLTWPVCARCLRLKRKCSGPRDLRKYEFHDESQMVIHKSLGKSAPPLQTIVRTPGSSTENDSSGATAQETISRANENVSPYTPQDEVAVVCGTEYSPTISTLTRDFSYPPLVPLNNLGVTIKADDIAEHAFLTSFTSSTPGLWGFMRSYALESKANPCLDRAVRACGMAAFVGARNAQEGVPYARAMYNQALGLINKALSDPRHNTTDECLMAVLLMGYYEVGIEPAIALRNRLHVILPSQQVLTAEGESSFQLWKAHTSGLREMLKLRGRRQLESLLGRHLFREIEAHIIIQAISDAEEPPDFLFEWEDDFEALSTEVQIAFPSDSLTKICIAYARMRARLRLELVVADADAFAEANHIARRLEQWSNCAMDGPLHYMEIDVPDSPHVWNGTLHMYSSRFAVGAWMAQRCIRILVSQTQEMLSTRLPLSAADQDAQLQHCRKVQRQTTNDICAAVPAILDYSNASGGTACTVANVYSVVWPLFLAGTCIIARNRTGSSTGSNANAWRLPQTSATLAQAAWIVGRMDYISTQHGLKWASVTAATLRSRLSPYL